MDVIALVDAASREVGGFSPGQIARSAQALADLGHFHERFFAQVPASVCGTQHRVRKTLFDTISERSSGAFYETLWALSNRV